MALSKSQRYFFALWVWLLLLLACRAQTSPATPAPIVPSPTQLASSTPAVSSTVANQGTVNNNDTVRELTVLYTNDEHGWMEGMAPGEGAANLMGLWREAEGYQENSHFLILSGGDMWTGPAISTWFDGESMTEVMNTMGYAAAAVGNHEFDFGLDALRARAGQATFPFLSANIRYRRNGAIPTDLGIQPYTIVATNGIQVGIVGLTSLSTPQTTNPVNVASFEFLDYEVALREVVPQVQAAGAELILAPAHVCQAELESLAQQIGDLGIHMLAGGHCNELFATEINGMTVVGGGYHFTSYARVAFRFDTANDTVVDVEADVRPNTGGVADAQIEAVVAGWRAETSQELDVVIGYTQNGVARRSQAMQDLITESWLMGYPTANVAITNLGGMRAALPPGDMTLADIIGVLPFNNVIIELRLSGRQLLQVLAFAVGDAAIGGIHLDGARWVFNQTGVALDPAQTYSVLVNDFMYAGGDNYGLLAEFDPDAYNTAIDWRQPVIDWVLAQNSSAGQPIDKAINQLGQP
jgi:2',3'-cyclic-nucleotide 2'-phosphodiesterase (5'-nucleotidase family)